MVMFMVCVPGEMIISGYCFNVKVLIKIWKKQNSIFTQSNYYENYFVFSQLNLLKNN